MKNLSGKLIYIVDDDPEMCILLKQFLKNTGAELKVFNDIDAAQCCMEMDFPHLVILDYDFGDKTSVEFLKYRDKSKTLKYVDILMLTALTNKKTIKSLAKYRIKEFVIKPFRGADFITRIYKILTEQKHLTVAPDESKKIVCHAEGNLIKINDEFCQIKGPFIIKNGPIIVDSEFLSKKNILRSNISSTQMSWGVDFGDYCNTLIRIR